MIRFGIVNFKVFENFERPFKRIHLDDPTRSAAGRGGSNEPEQCEHEEQQIVQYLVPAGECGQSGRLQVRVKRFLHRMHVRGEHKTGVILLDPSGVRRKPKDVTDGV